MPVWVPPYYDPNFDISFGINMEGLKKALDENRGDVACVVIVSPTYDGVIADIKEVAGLCHEHNVALVVDEAHGAHLGQMARSSNRSSDRRLDSATARRADVVIQSTHKCLSSLTQSAMLHLPHESLIDSTAIDSAIPLVQSSSPSYLLMASLDAARWQYAYLPNPLFQTLHVLSACARERINRIPGLQVLDSSRLTDLPHGAPCVDPSRITVLSTGAGISGFRLAELLEERGVYVEMATRKCITLALSIGNSIEDVDLLTVEMERIILDSERREKDTEKSYDHHSLPFPTLSFISQPELSPREIFLSPRVRVATADAVGRISAETICPYPPGIPVLLPGERVTNNTIDALLGFVAEGGRVVGAIDSTLRTLDVLDFR